MAETDNIEVYSEDGEYLPVTAVEKHVGGKLVITVEVTVAERGQLSD